METACIQAFLEAVRQGSISRAAEALGYTQSAVSRQIAVLEGSYGARLVDRLPRGVAPTAAGTVLMPHLEAALKRLSDGQRDIKALLQGEYGGLRVGAFSTAMAWLVPRALSEVRKRFPEMTLSLVEGRTAQLLEAILRGDCDVAVVSGEPNGISDHGLDFHTVLDETMLIAVPSDHALARRRVVRLVQFRDDAFIVGSAVDEAGLLRARLPPSFQPRVDLVVSDWIGKLGCVAAGLGVALLPALAETAAPPGVTMLRVDRKDALVRRVFVASRAGTDLLRPARFFIQQLRDGATKRPGISPREN